MKNKNTKRVCVLAVKAVVLIIFALVATVIFNGKGVQQIQEQPQIIQKERRLIDGVFVLPDQVNPLIAGAMIENMVSAQPLSGIADARLVFEAVVEANITRFLAYFVLEDVDGGSTSVATAVEPRSVEIGPVRSARPYYLDFAAPFNALYAHVGSSPAAYELLRKNGVEGVNDLDQWYNSEYFFSKTNRSKPHHIYTSTELLEQAHQNYVISTEAKRSGEISDADAYKGITSIFWKFKNDSSPDLRGDVRDIRVNYAAPYNVQWLYDKSENYYKRVQWGSLHKDANGKEIVAKNIAVAFMKMKVLDAVGRKEFTTLGQGKGLVFQDGRVVVGTWKKEKASDMLRWYDSQGNEVEFNTGITWVEIVPEGWKVEY